VFSQPQIAVRALAADCSHGAPPPCPLTLRHVLALAALGLADPGAELSALDEYRRAFLLSQCGSGLSAAIPPSDDAVLDWANALPAAAAAPQLLRDAYALQWRDACDALGELRPPKHGDDDRFIEEITVGEDKGNGIGWLLTIVEAFAADYGWRVGEILDLPVITAFALLTASRLRNGWTWSGPSYADEERLEKMEEERAEKEEVAMAEITTARVSSEEGRPGNTTSHPPSQTMPRTGTPR